jgi:Flp pilus assembly pilin Flp
MRGQFRALWQDESGQDLTEYALLIGLVTLAMVASMKALARASSTVYSNAAKNVTTNT